MMGAVKGGWACIKWYRGLSKHPKRVANAGFTFLIIGAIGSFMIWFFVENRKVIKDLTNHRCYSDGYINDNATILSLNDFQCVWNPSGFKSYETNIGYLEIDEIYYKQGCFVDEWKVLEMGRYKTRWGNKGEIPDMYKNMFTLTRFEETRVIEFNLTTYYNDSTGFGEEPSEFYCIPGNGDCSNDDSWLRKSLLDSGAECFTDVEGFLYLYHPPKLSIWWIISGIVGVVISFIALVLFLRRICQWWAHSKKKSSFGNDDNADVYLDRLDDDGI